MDWTLGQVVEEPYMVGVGNGSSRGCHIGFNGALRALLPLPLLSAEQSNEWWKCYPMVMACRLLCALLLPFRGTPSISLYTMRSYSNTLVIRCFRRGDYISAVGRCTVQTATYLTTTRWI